MRAFFSLEEYLLEATKHQQDHKCTAVPYDNGEMLTTIVAAIKPKRVLELGTGIGYSTACIAAGFDQATIETIDQDKSHITLAKEFWRKMKLQTPINLYTEKAEVILPSLQGPYDIIFFDGNAPSMKFLIQFERLLQKGGVLMTANLFLKDPKGGAYVRNIQNPRKWQTVIISDTALSVK